MAKIKFRAKEGGGDFTLVPQGTYECQIVDVEYEGLTSKDGEPQIKITFEIGGGSDYSGQKIPQWLTMNDKFGWKLDQLVEASGIEYEVVGEETGSDGKKIRELSFDPDDLLQTWVQIELSHWTSKKDNKTYHQVDKYLVSTVGAESEESEAPPPAGSDEAAAPPQAAPQDGAVRRRRPGA